MDSSTDEDEGLRGYLETLLRLGAGLLDLGSPAHARERREMLSKFIQDDVIGFIKTSLKQHEEDATLHAASTKNVYDLMQVFFSGCYPGVDPVPGTREIGNKDRPVVSCDDQEITFNWNTMNRYYVKTSNKTDIFIHKGLKESLDSKLDSFVKNPFLNGETLSPAGGAGFPRTLNELNAFKEACDRIICYLDSAERFKKCFYEKKKLVLSAGYCITAGQVSEPFYPEILANGMQVAAWKLYHEAPIDEAFLKAHPNLVVDTGLFDAAFKYRLLSSLEDIDRVIDGVIIKSDNFQALNLLQAKFYQSVKCIYIDPPYNTGGVDFVYKNMYKHASWCSMISDAVRASIPFLKEDGVLFCAIDDKELFTLGMVLDGILGRDNYLGTLVVVNKPSGRTNDKFLASCHEYYLCYAKDASKVPGINFSDLNELQASAYKLEDERGKYKWRDFLRTGGLSLPELRPNSCYPIYYDERSGTISTKSIERAIVIWPIDSKGTMRVWRKTRPALERHVTGGEIRVSTDAKGKHKVFLKDRIKAGVRPKSVWVDSRYDASTYGTKILKDMFPAGTQFDYPKSIHAVQDVIRLVCDPGRDDIILDYFAGSGTTAHAIMNMNEDAGGGKMKYIMVERGEYFEPILKERIKKVMHARKWAGGRPKNDHTIHRPHAFKYVFLEQYDDALNITGPREPGRALDLAVRAYPNCIVDYFTECKELATPYLARDVSFEHPFGYALAIVKNGDKVMQPVDLVETFNYLLGIHVKSMQPLEDAGRAYLVVAGQVDRQHVIIAWRDLAGIDFSRDKRFIEEKILPYHHAPDAVYVNGACIVENVRIIEARFRELMGP